VSELEEPSRRPGVADAGPVSFAIFSLARAHRGFAGELLRDFGLHPGQELLLMQLLDRDGQTQSELLEPSGSTTRRSRSRCGACRRRGC